MEVARICLDTSAYSHFCRGTPSAVDALSRARVVYLPAIVLGELRTGFALGRRRQDNETALRIFLDRRIVEVLDVDDEASRHYADIVVQLRRAGSPLPTNDIWIAALASRVGATVLTFDQHFLKIVTVGTLLLRAGRPT